MNAYYIGICIVAWTLIGIVTLWAAIRHFEYDPDSEATVSPFTVTLLWPISWIIIMMIVARRLAKSFQDADDA